MPQGCLTQWPQTVQAIETMGLLMQIQTETRWRETGQSRGAVEWALLAGIGLMGTLALSTWLFTAPHIRKKRRGLRGRSMPTQSQVFRRNRWNV